MKNIIVFTYGDAENPSTWSNVPYLLTNAFEDKGYNVTRIDMSTKQNIFTLLYTLIVKIIKPSTTFYFVKSNINRKIVEKKIKKAVEEYDNIADLYISISYDFSPSKYTNKPVLLFSDWPMEYAIEERFNRKIDFLEKKDIERHREVIEDATYRVTLFKDVCKYMNNRFKGKTVYLGGLINSFYSIDGFESIKSRNKITFIGKKSYRDCAKELIKAFELLNERQIKEKNLELHIIGMTKKDFNNINNDNIYFHGYLDKGKEKDKELYYNILKETIVIVNTSEKWAGMSSVMEAMYYYRPIITSKYTEYVKTFGSDIKFGYYSKNNYKEILKYLNKIISMNDGEYKKLSNASHEAVKEYTYDAYVDKIMNLIKNK